MSLKQIVIFEPYCEGHKLFHCRRIARCLCAHDCKVILATRKACFHHPLILSMRRELGTMYELLEIPDCTWEHRLIRSKRWFVSQLGYYLWFCLRARGPIQKKCPEYIFIPYLDYFVYAAGLLGSPFHQTRWGGMLMSLRIGYQEMGIRIHRYHKLRILKEYAFLRLIQHGHIDTVFSIQEPPVRYIERTRPHLSSRFQYVPDPIPELKKIKKETARAVFHLPEGKILILLYGEISLRKGLKELIESFRQSTFPPDVDLILAGRQTEDGTQYLNTQWPQHLMDENRLFIINRFIDDEEESILFSACDIVWVAYKNFSLSSGVLYLAAEMGRPVIGSACGLIEYTIEKEKIGMTVDLDNEVSIINAISILSADKQRYKICQENALKLAKKHDEQIFIDQISNKILMAISTKA